MYYFIAALIVIITAALSLSHLFKSDKGAKIAKAASLFLAALGAAFLAFVIISLKKSLNNSGLDADTVSWAKDMYFLYLRWAGIFTAAVGAAVILSSLIQPKRKGLRSAVCILADLIILLTCPLYSFVTDGAAVTLSGYVLLTGIALSLVVPVFRFADTGKKQSRKTNETNGKEKDLTKA